MGSAVKIKRPGSKRPRIKGGRLTDIQVPESMRELDQYRAEIDEYWDVLLGRVDPPIDKGVHTLQEVATVYYARAKEIHAIIKDGEAEGYIIKNSAEYKFRTGKLRDFIEVASKAADLGSRRVTVAQLAAEMKLDAADLDMEDE
jgi:RNAse (barnase) inhibitor barstar